MSTAAHPIRICLVAPSAFGELSGVPNGHIGGSERALASMARWLARRGHVVTMITWDEGAGDAAYDGVAVITTCASDAGLRGLRFVHPRWTSLYRALRRADAEVYHYRCGDLGLGQITWWCRRHRRRVVFSIDADVACDPRLRHLTARRERILYRYGLRHAHLVVAQTQRQKRMMREGFGIDCPVTGTPNDVQPRACRTAAAETRSRVLWIGRFAEQKRLERLLDAAERLPDLSFDVAGGANTESTYASKLLRRARSIPNVTLHGMLPRDELGILYETAAVLCHTSDYEGFPHVFIEAWRHGIPVVSTVDPDDVIARFGLGQVAAGVDGIVAALAELVGAPEQRRLIAAAALSYAQEHCSLADVMQRFEKLFTELVS